MLTAFRINRIQDYQPRLFGFAVITLVASMILLYAGGFTTTIGAGMVFADWPLSDGSLNPPGWTSDQAMFAEHSHRLMGMLVGLLCLSLAIWIYLRDSRLWMRQLGFFALVLVIIQGLLGGARVLLVSVDLAKVHGVMGQIFICSLVALVVGSTDWWRKIRVPKNSGGRATWNRLRNLGLTVCGLTMIQLVLGAVMRHRGAGLSIPYFPHASPDGGFLPLSWNWATQVHFSHRLGALVVFGFFVYWLFLLTKTEFLRPIVKGLASTALFVVLLQIYLGAMIIWTARSPVETSVHVLNGAIFLCLIWAVTFTFFKPLLEKRR